MTEHHIRTAALTAATAALALALTLTACGGSPEATGTKAAGGSAAKPAAEAPARTASGSGPAVASGANGTAGTADGSGRTRPVRRAADGVRACAGDEISYGVLHRFPGLPGEHLLVSAENAGSRPCRVTSYPSVMLGDSDRVLGHSPEDAPGGAARIVLEPGATAYAAVALHHGSGKERRAGGLSIALRDASGDTGPGHELDAFDAEGVPSVFTWSSADVTRWNRVKPYDFR
ncbi:DUF4232 domain-containing protein [Streptomyces bambusae]|uniref:DUF4232 domain-containing protein n=1 Tax=Streptomyces bambusae TaxID=1550616 RepID=UPI001CFEA933|nr:DUF4232 domain-containing protein [Streptomyces bambusae]MCB5167747.1 DUF4232 domain-containing protein [Streptomyces bambusae]